MSTLPQSSTASVSQTTLLGVLWSGAALSVAVVSARLLFRAKLLGRFKTDDYLVIGGLFLHLASAIIWSVLGNDLYFTLNYGFGGVNQPNEALQLEKIGSVQHGKLASYFCTWTCLWLIKLSFMSFFYGLGRQIKAQQILWWCVLVFILVGYVVSVAMYDYQCLTSSGLEILTKCSTQKVVSDGYLAYAATQICTAFDIVTDISIMGVSANIVWRARLPWKKKLMLGFICSLTVFMMIAAIIRIVTDALGKRPDYSWLLVWNSVEMTLAIFVACIASFRSLYCYTRNTRQEQHNRSLPPERYVARRVMASESDNETVLSIENSCWTHQSSHDSQESIGIPIQGATLKPEI